jgi:hypothetical protein
MGAVKSTLGKIGGLIRSTIGTALNAAGIGGLLSGGGLLAGLNNIAGVVANIDDLSMRTGIAASTLMVMREQFRLGGLEINSVTNYIRRMFEALDDPNKSDVFRAMGLDQASLARMNPDMAFNKILDGVRKLGSRIRQTDVLSEIFGGRQGINLMTLVADPKSFTTAKSMVGSMAQDMDKLAPEIAKIEDVLGPGGLAVKAQQLFFGILKGFKDELLDLADTVMKLDFQKVGENITEWLRWGWATFQNLVANPSGVWAAMANGFKGVALIASSYLLGAIGTAITGGVDFAMKVVAPLGKSLWFIMKAVGGAFAIGMLEGLNTIKDALPQQMRDGLDLAARFAANFTDRTPMGKMMNYLTGTTARENTNLILDNPDIVRQAFEKGMQDDLLAAGTNIKTSLQKGGEVFADAVNKFEPNAYLFANGSANLLQAAEIFKTIPMPDKTPLQSITTSPGATSGQRQSIFNQAGDSQGLRVSLDNNKIEMSGPIAVRMVTSLESIEEKFAIE